MQNLILRLTELKHKVDSQPCRVSTIKVKPGTGKEWNTVNRNGHIELPNFDDFSLPMEDLPWFNAEKKHSNG